MAWPPTTTAGQFEIQGTTTIRWGTDGIYSTYIVTRATQKNLVENIKLPNGTGLTSTRVMLIDGVQWDITVRDDTAFAGGVTTAPTAGTTVSIVDMAGMLGTVATSYTARVVESSYEAAPKQAGERTITLEYLALLTTNN